MGRTREKPTDELRLAAMTFDGAKAPLDFLNDLTADYERNPSVFARPSNSCNGDRWGSTHPRWRRKYTPRICGAAS